MKTLIRTAVYLLFFLIFIVKAIAAQELQFAELGDFKLEGGDVLRDCRIGYRTFGKLNADKSNAILFTTWASGTTEQLKSNVGQQRLVDDAKYFVVAVDALSNGVSSSPSNSKLQPRMNFPKVTMRDMVNTQHELLTKVLRLNHLKAIIGISMGGMQTFQWLISYPNFMDKAIPIVGSPRLAPYDLMHWQTQLDAITNNAAWNNGNYVVNPTRVTDVEFGAILLTTPEHYNKNMTRQQVFEELEKTKKITGFDANDKIRQTQAMMSLDISEPFGGSMERATSAIKAKVFVIVSKTDHVVTPQPAVDFAHLSNSKLLELDNDCGHLAPSCESQRLNFAVKDFLEH